MDGVGGEGGGVCGDDTTTYDNTCRLLTAGQTVPHINKQPGNTAHKVSSEYCFSMGRVHCAEVCWLIDSMLCGEHAASAVAAHQD